MSKRLRIGLQLDTLDVPAWIWVAIQEISASSYAQIVAVALTGPAEEPPPPKGSLGWLGMVSRRALWRLDELADRRVPADQDAFITRDAGTLLEGVTVHRIEPGEGPDTFSDEDVARFQALDLDVLLALGSRVLRGDILKVARSGAWSFHLGDDRIRRGGPAGFWEVHESWPATGATLRMVGEGGDDGWVLARASSATVLTSVKRNRNGLIWKALPLLTRTLQRLRREGAAVFRESVERDNKFPTFYSNRLFRSPGPADLLVHAVRRLALLVAVVGRRLFRRQQWMLFYGMADDLVTACWRLHPLVPPRDRFWADPHALKVGDRYFVFVEELMFDTGKGHIALIEFDEQGRHSAARTVLEEPHHLSYPFVFEHRGDYFMIPESSVKETIDLYRATSFPDRWEFVEHLMTGVHAVDVTLLLERDKWWLFASVTQHKGAHSGELNLYSSDRLIGGDWRRHRASPLSSDVSNSRPAGGILRRNGRLYRPAQDGSGIYGRAIKLHEIVELSEDAYREQEVTRIEPEWDPRITRTHTLAHTGRLTVLDALWPRWRWNNESSAARDQDRLT